MNLAAAVCAFIAALLGAFLAAVDQLSDTFNVDLPVYLLILFIALAFFFLACLIPGVVKVTNE